MKVLLALIAFLAFAFMFLAFAFIGLKPCPTEDSTLCYWDASQHGNGKGNSFLSISETISIPLK